jgi:hypothetical protein
MKNTDLRAKARAIFGPAIAEPMPKQPNGAKALQQRANARPIPTYKVGGPVKKMPTPGESVKSGNRMSREEGDEMRFMDMMEKKKRPMPSPAASAASGNRMSRQEGAEMKKMKMAMGGKVQTSSDTARKLATEMGGYKKGGKVKDVEVDMKMLEEMSRPKMSMPNLESKVAEARSVNTARAKETSGAAKSKSFKEAFNEARRDQGPNGVFTWRGNTYNTKMAGESSKAAPARAAAPAAAPASRPAAPAAAAPASRPAATPPAAPANKSGNASSSMSSVIRNLDSGYDLDAEAKKIMAKRNDSFFRAPISMKEAREEARAAAEDVRKMSGYRAEQERKKKSLEAGRKANPDLVSRIADATMNPGYKKGGKVKEAKPKDGLAVMIAIGSPKKPTKKMDGGPMGYAAGGAGKARKGMMPDKFAQGGAGKVRKGMMSPEGNIIDAMNKMRGK